MIVYVSGPISAPTQWEQTLNINKAEEAFAELCRNNIPAICVHTMGRNLGNLLSHKQWMGLDIALLRACTDILMVHGHTKQWTESPGALMELREAADLKLRMHYNIGSVLKVAETQGA